MSMQRGEGEYRVVLTEPDGRESSCFTWAFSNPEGDAIARKAAIDQAKQLQSQIGDRRYPQPDAAGSRYRVLRVEATVTWDAAKPGNGED